MRVFSAVVNVVKHHVFNSDSALIGVGFLQITAHRSKERFDIVLFVDRHNFVTNFVVRRVQGNCQCNVDHIAQFIQRRNYTGSRKRDATFRQAKTEIIKHDFHRRNDVVQVEQRLAHAHHHYVSDWPLTGDFCCADDFRRPPHLADNFRHPQVAVKALLGGGTEFTLQRTPHLRRDAERGTVVFRDIHRFDALIANGDRPFNGAVG
ncbi:Uncharacterised protein [Shigella sonnei]|nr:Uncharacterised protein [Shigella sonnei]